MPELSPRCREITPAYIISCPQADNRTAALYLMTASALSGAAICVTMPA